MTNEITREAICWALEWRNKKCDPLAGPQHLIHDNLLPMLFKRKAQAKAYSSKRFGYIANRPDLRAAPFHWRMPKPVKVSIVVIDRPGVVWESKKGTRKSKEGKNQK